MERLRPSSRAEETPDEDTWEPVVGVEMDRGPRTPEASETGGSDMFIGEEGRDFWIEKELSYDEMRGLKFDEYEMVKLARQRWNERQRHERALREAEEARRRAADRTPEPGTPAEDGESAPAEGGEEPPVEEPAEAPAEPAEGEPEAPSEPAGEGEPGEGAEGTPTGETLGDKKNFKLGDTELSFSEIKLTSFDDTLKPGEELEDLENRRRLRDQNVLMAGLLFTEAGDKDGMKKAIEGGNYRLKRAQLREFYAAVAELPEGAFADKVVALLPALETEDERQMAMAAAIRIYDHALLLQNKKLAGELEDEVRRDYMGEDDRAPRIEVPEAGDGARVETDGGEAPVRRRRRRVEAEAEPSEPEGAPEGEPIEGGEAPEDGEGGDGEHAAGRRPDYGEWEGPFGEYRVYRPEVSAPQAERALDNPSIFYRRRKQERRAKGFFATMREIFKGEEEEKSVARRRSPSGSRTSEKSSTRVRPEGPYSASPRVRPGSRPEGGYFSGGPVETGGAKRPEGGYFRREDVRPAGERPASEKKNRNWDFSDYNDIDGADYAI